MCPKAANAPPSFANLGTMHSLDCNTRKLHETPRQVLLAKYLHQRDKVDLRVSSGRARSAHIPRTFMGKQHGPNVVRSSETRALGVGRFRCLCRSIEVPFLHGVVTASALAGE